ncbi:hypothetical protein Tco_0116421 [Tanacetum coccineum]
MSILLGIKKIVRLAWEIGGYWGYKNCLFLYGVGLMLLKREFVPAGYNWIIFMIFLSKVDDLTIGYSWDVVDFRRGCYVSKRFVVFCNSDIEIVFRYASFSRAFVKLFTSRNHFDFSVVQVSDAKLESDLHLGLSVTEYHEVM